MKLFSRIRSKGFTLIELIVVIAIMGVLITIVFGSISNARVKTRDNKRISDLKEIKYALTQYYATYTRFPADITSSPDVLAPFLNTIPTDPSSGQPYDYTSPSAQSFCIGAVFENASDVNAVQDNALCSTGNSADTYTLQNS